MFFIASPHSHCVHDARHELQRLGRRLPPLARQAQRVPSSLVSVALLRVQQLPLVAIVTHQVHLARRHYPALEPAHDPDASYAYVRYVLDV